jgi:NAD(P)-dependent dehydrogenase (short-subunit alcohol dehydrogenase family)
MTATQAPLGSGFGAASTADDVVAGIDLTGKTAIVTGGASGIGVPTVRALRGRAMVVVPARNVDAAAETLAGLDVEIRAMDLMVPKTIDVFAARFLASGRPLHLLVNNGGIGGAPLARDERGYESVFATNHLGHFHLTCRLWTALRAAEGARVVAVSSWAHRASPVVLDDLMFEPATTTLCSRMGSRRPRTSSTRSPSTSATRREHPPRSLFTRARSSTATSSGTRRPRCSPRSGSSTRTATP